MVENRIIFIRNGELKLEAEYYQSKEKDTSLAFLICHPHPEFGGNMHNNVVSGVFNKLVKNEISCLRFNFRAVGRSTGDHSNGSGELNDVKVCVDYLINEKKYESILICGYSYGAAIGCSTISYSKNAIGYISISFPWDFMGALYKEFFLDKDVTEELWLKVVDPACASGWNPPLAG